MTGSIGRGRPASRAVSDRFQDDTVLPFAVERLDVRGRIVRLGPSVDHILAQHAYPPPVARVVGEALALTLLLGSSLNIDGRFQLQTRSDGAIDMLVVDFDAPDRLRAFARFDAARLAAAAGQDLAGKDLAGRDLAGKAPLGKVPLWKVPLGQDLLGQDLLGEGHLAFTVDQGNDASRYQGIVTLAGQGLEDAAHRYFRQSEQIPTRVRLAVAQKVTPAGASWRAGGLMAQFLPSAGERSRRIDLDPGDAPKGATVETPPEEDAWTQAKAIAATIEDHELVDPTLSSERLLYRLFHEQGVKVFEPQSVRDACRCSDQGVKTMLRGFPAWERREMVGDDGRIGVTCEFCSAFRAFDPSEFET